MVQADNRGKAAGQPAVDLLVVGALALLVSGAGALLTL